MLAMRCYDSTTGLIAATTTGLTALDVAGAQMSWAAWVWYEGGTGTNCLWTHSDNANPATRNGYAVMLNGTAGGAFFDITIRMCTGSANNAVGSGSPVNMSYGSRIWVHIGWTHDGASLLYYLNGKVALRKAAAFTPTVAGTRVTTIGVSANGFNGGMFDLQIFPNIVLNPAEMRALMDPRLTIRAGDCKQRLFRNWQPAASGTVRDESGNSTDLTANATLKRCDGFSEPQWQRILEVRPMYYNYRALSGLVALLTPAALRTGAPVMTLLPGGIIAALNAAPLRTAAPNTTVLAGGIVVALTTAAKLRAFGPTTSVVSGGQIVSMGVAQAKLRNPNTLLLPGGVTVVLTPAQARLVAKTTSAASGAVIVLMSPAAARLQAASFAVPGVPLFVSLLPAIARLISTYLVVGPLGVEPDNRIVSADADVGTISVDTDNKTVSVVYLDVNSISVDR